MIHEYCGEHKEWRIIDENTRVLSNLGSNPFHRNLKQLLDYGVINIDKPPGPTSHEVVAWIKKMLSIKRAGHGGTLEPQYSMN